MANTDQIISEIRALPDEERLQLLDVLLMDLSDSIDHTWILEARKRWNAYKAGRLGTVSYEELIGKYNR